MSAILFLDPVCQRPYDTRTLATQASGGIDGELLLRAIAGPVALDDARAVARRELARSVGRMRVDDDDLVAEAHTLEASLDPIRLIESDDAGRKPRRGRSRHRRQSYAAAPARAWMWARANKARLPGAAVSGSMSLNRS